jgi:hypothetical protein
VESSADVDAMLDSGALNVLEPFAILSVSGTHKCIKESSVIYYCYSLSVICLWPPRASYL